MQYVLLLAIGIVRERSHRLPAVLCACLAFLWLSSSASAQSTISGVVKDASGAVMAGVKVEAASEVLIEKSRVVLTSGDGRYAIVDLRPGLYTMTFAVPGFATVKQQVDVPALFCETHGQIFERTDLDGQHIAVRPGKHPSEIRRSQNGRNETKMICPDCGAEMNQHAEKLIEPTTAEEAGRMDPELDALVEEFHTCPKCGKGAARPGR